MSRAITDKTKEIILMLSLIVVLLIVGVVLYGISAFPVPPMIRTLIYCVVAIALILYLASMFGVNVGKFPR